MLPANFEGVDVSVSLAAGAGEAAVWAVVDALGVAVDIFENGFSAGLEGPAAVVFSDAKGFAGALADDFEVEDGPLAGSVDFAGEENDCAKTLDVAESLVPLTVGESLAPFVIGVASMDCQLLFEPTGAPMARRKAI